MQGRGQARTEPASNPTPPPQRWRDWGLSRIHSFPQDPRRVVPRNSGFLNFSMTVFSRTFVGRATGGLSWKGRSEQLAQHEVLVTRHIRGAGGWPLQRCMQRQCHQTRRPRRLECGGRQVPKRLRTFTLKEAGSRQVRRTGRRARVVHGEPPHRRGQPLSLLPRPLLPLSFSKLQTRRCPPPPLESADGSSKTQRVCPYAHWLVPSPPS